MGRQTITEKYSDNKQENRNISFIFSLISVFLEQIFYLESF